MIETLTAAVATEHARDSQRRAAGSRLAALARCCNPSGLRRTGEAVRAQLRSARQRLTSRPTVATCCA